MTAFTIRSVTDQDIPFLWEMLFVSLYIPEGETPPDKAIIHDPSLSKYVEGWGRDGDMGFIAISSTGQRLGTITIRYFNKATKGYGYVNDQTPELGIALLAECRGRGIGTELLKTLIVHAKKKHIPALSLSVDPNNPAIHLYKRFGFLEVGMVETSATMLLNL